MFLSDDGERKASKHKELEIGEGLVMPGNRVIPVAITNHGSRGIVIYEDQTLGRIVSLKTSKAPFVRTPGSGYLTLRDAVKERDERRIGLAHSVRKNKKDEKLLTLKDMPKSFKEEKIDVEGLNEEQVDGLIRLIIRNEKAFSKHPYDLGNCTVVEASVDTGDAKPISCNPYRLPYAMREHLKKELEEMLKEGIIEESDSPWASPMLYVPKADGTHRLVVDFRRLNAVCKPDVYPLPRIDDVIAALHGARWFSSLDMRKSFWQLAVEEDSKDKLTFTTPFSAV